MHREVDRNIHAMRYLDCHLAYVRINLALCGIVENSDYFGHSLDIDFDLHCFFTMFGNLKKSLNKITSMSKTTASLIVSATKHKGSVTVLPDEQ